MCIRDSTSTGRKGLDGASDLDREIWADFHADWEGLALECCLLYTSDAADERSSVDLGGRRIIKKKKKLYQIDADAITNKSRDDNSTTEQR